MKTDPVITGIGLISPIGNDRKTFLTSILNSRSGIEKISEFDTSPFKCSYYAPVRHLEKLLVSCPDRVRRWDRHTAMAFLAGRAALADAGFDPAVETNCFNSRRFGLIFATCSGGMLSIEKHYTQIFGKQPSGGSLTRELSDAKRYYQSAYLLSREFGITGFVTTVVTACSASTNAVGMARDLIQSGKMDHILVIGSDSFAPSTFAGFDLLKATSDHPCAPFSLPIGLNLGEGSGAWIIESSAARENQRIYGYVRGYGLGNDAYHPTAPDPSARGAILAMTRALSDAGLQPGDIGYINAHGTGTQANDKIESKAISKVFGPEDIPPVSSTKSFFGHTLGAAGILEATASILALHHEVLPPTLNFTTPRDGCHLDYIPNECRTGKTDVVLSNGFAFAGNNCSLIISRKKPEQNAGDRQPAPKRVFITGTGAVSQGISTMEAFPDA